MGKSGYGFSSREIYDEPAYEEEVERSVGPMHYRLQEFYGHNPGGCFAPFGPRSIKGVSYAPYHPVDLDTAITNRSQIKTKSARYNQPASLKQFETVHYPECNDFIAPEYSRFITPSFEVKGLTRDPFYPLHHDPQCHIFTNFEVNTRRQAIDDHVADWHIPMDQKDLLPTERLAPVKAKSNRRSRYFQNNVKK